MTERPDEASHTDEPGLEGAAGAPSAEPERADVEQPAADAPAGDPPADEAPDDEVPADGAPADETVDDDVSSDEQPDDEVADGELSDDELPDDEAPVEDGAAEHEADEPVVDDEATDDGPGATEDDPTAEDAEVGTATDDAATDDAAADDAATDDAAADVEPTTGEPTGQSSEEVADGTVDETPADEPVRDQPADETSVDETADETSLDEPVLDGTVDETAVDEPVVEESVDEPVVDEAADEPVTDENADKPVTDEPVVEEDVDEPVADEPVVAAAADETSVDEPVVDEPVVDEPVVDEAADEPVAGAEADQDLAWVADRAAFADRQRQWAAEDAETAADAEAVEGTGATGLADDAEPADSPVEVAPADTQATQIVSPPPPPPPAWEPESTPEPDPEPELEPEPEPAGAATAVLPPLPPVPPAPPAAPERPTVGAPAVPAERADGGDHLGRGDHTGRDDHAGRDHAPAGHPRRRRRRLVALAVSAVVLVLLAGAYVGALWLWSDRVPPGTTVAGVDIGGMSADTAIATLDEQLNAATTEPLEVAAGDQRTSLEPQAAGLAFDATATVEGTTGFGLEPSRLWAQLFGAGAIEPVSDVDTAALEHALGDVVDSLSVAPVDGGIQFVDGAPQPSASTEGVTLDVPAAVELLAASWLTQARPIDLPTKVDPPDVDDADVQEALAQLAEPLRSAPVRVEAAGQVAELPVDVLTSAASFVPEDGELSLVMDGPVLVEAVVARTTNLLTAAEEPTFTFDANGPVIVPGAPGTALDPDALATAVAEAATAAGDRTAAVELVESDPAESVAEMEALGITQIVSEFSTPLTSEPRRTQNIANGASKLNGMLIRPGEEFNLAEALGPLDAAHGYVEAGVILSGQHTDAWGGGLSQMSTTTYNAAFFAGYELVEHQAHSEWFRRYPEGREATIFTPQINMRWRNNTPYGALLQSWVADGRVYVRVWSTPYFTVETTTSGRSNVVQPTTVYSQSPTCEGQSAGNPGFTVTVTRTVFLDGVQQNHESWTTRYKPQNAIVCGTPPAG